MAGGLAVLAVVAGVQLARFRRVDGVWLCGFASRVVLGTATAASVSYAVALAAAIRQHTRVAELDEHVVALARLRLMTTLTAVSEAEFATVREALNVSDSVLSKHLGALEEDIDGAPPRV